MRSQIRSLMLGVLCFGCDQRVSFEDVHCLGYIGASRRCCGDWEKQFPGKSCNTKDLVPLAGECGAWDSFEEVTAVGSGRQVGVSVHSNCFTCPQYRLVLKDPATGSCEELAIHSYIGPLMMDTVTGKRGYIVADLPFGGLVTSKYSARFVTVDEMVKGR